MSPKRNKQHNKRITVESEEWTADNQKKTNFSDNGPYKHGCPPAQSYRPGSSEYYNRGVGRGSPQQHHNNNQRSSHQNERQGHGVGWGSSNQHSVGQSNSGNKQWQAEKQKYLMMDLNTKRQHYKCRDRFIPLDTIHSWQNHYEQNLSHEKPHRELSMQVEDWKMNQRVSVYQGDITLLEVEGVVCATSPSMQAAGAGVDSKIHEGAGPWLAAECYGLYCNPGDVCVTGAYLLPAKYVLHTVGPNQKQQRILENCYKSIIMKMVQHSIHTVAIPCIATGTNGFPRQHAAEIALNMIKYGLVKHPEIERVVFCVYANEDLQIYESLLQEYFPPASSHLPMEVKGDAFGYEDQSEYFSSFPSTGHGAAAPAAGDGAVGAAVGTHERGVDRGTQLYSTASDTQSMPGGHRTLPSDHAQHAPHRSQLYLGPTDGGYLQANTDSSNMERSDFEATKMFEDVKPKDVPGNQIPVDAHQPGMTSTGWEGNRAPGSTHTRSLSSGRGRGWSRNVDHPQGPPPPQEMKQEYRTQQQQTLTYYQQQQLYVGQQRAHYLALSLEDKRALYKCKDQFVTLQMVKTWAQYYQENHGRIANKYPSQCKPDERINKRVSIWRGDITTIECDAIVNAANENLLGGGGVDQAIHAAAGSALFQECSLLNGCHAGNAKITAGYNLPAKYVIHAVGPRGYKPPLLAACYSTSLNIMLEQGLRTIAFPCISTGIFGFPQEAAAQNALMVARQYLEEFPQIERIIFCLFMPQDVHIYEQAMQYYFPPVLRVSSDQKGTTNEQISKEGDNAQPNEIDTAPGTEQQKVSPESGGKRKNKNKNRHSKTPTEDKKMNSSTSSPDKKQQNKQPLPYDSGDVRDSNPADALKYQDTSDAQPTTTRGHDGRDDTKLSDSYKEEPVAQSVSSNTSAAVVDTGPAPENGSDIGSDSTDHSATIEGGSVKQHEHKTSASCIAASFFSAAAQVQMNQGSAETDESLSMCVTSAHTEFGSTQSKECPAESDQRSAPSDCGLAQVDHSTAQLGQSSKQPIQASTLAGKGYEDQSCCDRSQSMVSDSNDVQMSPANDQPETTQKKQWRSKEENKEYNNIPREQQQTRTTNEYKAETEPTADADVPQGGEPTSNKDSDMEA